MFGDDFDNLNPAFQDLGAWVEVDDPAEWYDEDNLLGYHEDDVLDYHEDDDFPIDLEYDEGEDDMYADGDFFTNEIPW